MAADEEGFPYPKVDQDKCTNCGLCNKVCPILHKTQEIPCQQTAYLVQHKNEQVRQESTSGGAFTAIAQYVIRHGGVVFGAAWDESFHAFHKYVEQEEALSIFRNSKYVQSEIRDSFRQVKNFLEIGRLVCFSGTPCQIEGLKAFLQRDYENLFTVDVVCRAVASPMIFQKYIDSQRKRYSYSKQFRNILFRDKAFYGYQYSQLSLKADDGKILYHSGVESDPYMRAFFSNICDRPSCYHCQFKKRYRLSDFTLWDCFEPSRYGAKDMDDGKGTTRMLIHTDKGRRLFESVKESVNTYPLNAEKAIKGANEMFNSVPENRNRQEFFQDALNLSNEELFKKYFPDSLKVKTERNLRKISYKLGIYKYVRKTYRLIVHKC